MASAASSGSTPAEASDMTRSTTATLEWAIHVTSAAAMTATYSAGSTG